jgi:hypothetical protein
MIRFAAVIILLFTVSVYPQTAPAPPPVFGTPLNTTEAEKIVSDLLTSTLGKAKAEIIAMELKPVYLSQEEYFGILLTFLHFLSVHPNLNNVGLLTQAARFYVKNYSLIVGTLREKDIILLRAAEKLLFLYYKSPAGAGADPNTENMSFQKNSAYLKNQIPEKLVDLRGIVLMLNLFDFVTSKWAFYPKLKP